MIGFGIDLAGYATGKTSVAVVEIDGRTASVTLLRGSSLSKKRKGSEELKDVLAEDVKVLKRCLALGRVAVDIPIDLQGLPNPKKPNWIWALTRRPIDKAVNAMPPFADRIGAPVVRFAAIMRRGNLGKLLGKTLFEAYPAVTLRMLRIRAGKYKGANSMKALTRLCKTLGIKPRVKNDDDIDAIICAITAVTPARQLHKAKAFKVQGPMPRGFRIPKTLAFDKISVTTSNFDKWMSVHESQ
jgi:predicted RNase H-like nuclease